MGLNVFIFEFPNSWRGVLLIMKKIFIILAIISSVSTFLLLPSQPVYAATNNCERTFLGFPVWFRGLTVSNTNCELKRLDKESPDFAEITDKSKILPIYIGKIVLNVVEMLLMAVGYVAVGFILYGGFMYLTSGGNAENVKKAKSAITGAVIGLVICLTAIIIVNFIFGVIS